MSCFWPKLVQVKDLLEKATSGREFMSSTSELVQLFCQRQQLLEVNPEFLKTNDVAHDKKILRQDNNDNCVGSAKQKRWQIHLEFPENLNILPLFPVESLPRFHSIFCFNIGCQFEAPEKRFPESFPIEERA